MWNRDNANNYINLANAIVIQACDDYMAAKRKLIKTMAKRNNPQNDLVDNDLGKINEDIIRYTSIVESCVTFFRSEWAKELSDIDLMMIRRKMDEEIEKEVRK